MEDFLSVVVLGLIIWGVIAWKKNSNENNVLFNNIRLDCIEYIGNKYKKYAKCLPVNTYSYLLVDDKEKIFKIDTYANNLLSGEVVNTPYESELTREQLTNMYIRKQIDITRFEEIIPTPYEMDVVKENFLDKYRLVSETHVTRDNNGEFKRFDGDIMKEIFSLVNEDEIKFDDLIKIDIIDRTIVNTTRQFTMESKTGDSLVGAFLGDAFLGGINGSTIGAIAGASGKRNITETESFEDRKIAFDIVLYLNRLNNNTLIINVTNEEKLRELIGTFQYILNNKTK